LFGRLFGSMSSVNTTLCCANSPKPISILFKIWKNAHKPSCRWLRSLLFYVPVGLLFDFFFFVIDFRAVLR
jgi:hypothetical protein